MYSQEENAVEECSSMASPVVEVEELSGDDVTPNFSDRVWSKVCKAISKRVHDQHQVSTSRTSVSRTPPPVDPVQALNTQNLQALLDLAQQLLDGNTEVAGKANSHKKKRDPEDSSESDSDSDPFMDKKKRVKLDDEQSAFVNKVFREWLSGKEMDKCLKHCHPLKKEVTVPRHMDQWMINLLDKVA